MRKFKVTVNGKTYEVEVEEIKAEEEKELSKKEEIVEVKEVPKQEEKVSTGKGSKVVSAPMPGTILDVKVREGDRVKRGDVLLILEAMKMENEIMAPEDGIVASVNVSKGASVNTGDVLITME
jgi:biotin carboxyl carrier protein